MGRGAVKLKELKWQKKRQKEDEEDSDEEEPAQPAKKKAKSKVDSDVTASVDEKVDDGSAEIKASRKKARAKADEDATAETPAKADEGKAEKSAADSSAKMKASEARRLKKAEARAATTDADAQVEKEAKPSKSGTVFVSGMTPSFNVEEFKKLFEECGKIDNLSIPMRDARKGRPAVPRGIAFITYGSQKAVKRALTKNQTTFEERLLKVVVSTSKGSTPDGASAEDEASKSRGAAKAEAADMTLFVRNLPKAVPEETIRAHFRKCGNISGCRILRDKGIAFIKYKRQEGYDKALSLDGSTYEGRTIVVAKAGKGGAAKAESSDQVKSDQVDAE